MATIPVLDLSVGDRFHHPQCGHQPAVLVSAPMRHWDMTWRVSLVFLNPFTGLHQQQWFCATATVDTVD